MSDDGHIVRQVSFVKSAGGEGAYPDHELPEIAFAGRSNCGKSSLINTMTNRKRLARVSRTPGRTQLVNFFNVDEQVMFVDLPGYGFAKVPQAVREAWGPMVGRYLQEREALKALLILMDVRRDPGDEEHQLVAWCRARGLRVIHVATKFDKLRPNARKLRLQKMARAYDIPQRALVGFSSVTREGRENLWRRIFRVLELGEQP